MRRVETIRGLGRLTPPLIVNVPGYGPKLTCVAEEQDLYPAREATRADFTREEWENTPCAGPVLGPYAVSATPSQPASGRTPQAPPPGVTITDPERIRREENERIRREEEEYDRQRELKDQARRERQRLAELERQRLDAEREQRRIREELERNRRQLAERQQTTAAPPVTVPANAPTGAENEKGGFPWWLLALLLASQ